MLEWLRSNQLWAAEEDQGLLSHLLPEATRRTICVETINHFFSEIQNNSSHFDLNNIFSSESKSRLVLELLGDSFSLQLDDIATIEQAFKVYTLFTEIFVSDYAERSNTLLHMIVQMTSLFEPKRLNAYNKTPQAVAVIVHRHMTLLHMYLDMIRSSKFEFLRIELASIIIGISDFLLRHSSCTISTRVVLDDCLEENNGFIANEISENLLPFLFESVIIVIDNRSKFQKFEYLWKFIKLNFPIWCRRIQVANHWMSLSQELIKDFISNNQTECGNCLVKFCSFINLIGNDLSTFPSFIALRILHGINKMVDLMQKNNNHSISITINSILRIFGNWLVGIIQSTINLNENENNLVNNYFEYGKAKALGILCRIYSNQLDNNENNNDQKDFLMPSMLCHSKFIEKFTQLLDKDIMSSTIDEQLVINPTTLEILVNSSAFFEAVWLQCSYKKFSYIIIQAVSKVMDCLIEDKSEILQNYASFSIDDVRCLCMKAMGTIFSLSKPFKLESSDQIIDLSLLLLEKIINKDVLFLNTIQTYQSVIKYMINYFIIFYINFCIDNTDKSINRISSFHDLLIDNFHKWPFNVQLMSLLALSWSSGSLKKASLDKLYTLLQSSISSGVNSAKHLIFINALIQCIFQKFFLQSELPILNTIYLLNSHIDSELYYFILLIVKISHLNSRLQDYNANKHIKTEKNISASTSNRVMRYFPSFTNVQSESNVEFQDEFTEINLNRLLIKLANYNLIQLFHFHSFFKKNKFNALSFLEFKKLHHFLLNGHILSTNSDTNDCKLQWRIRSSSGRTDFIFFPKKYNSLSKTNIENFPIVEIEKRHHILFVIDIKNYQEIVEPIIEHQFIQKHSASPFEQVKKNFSSIMNTLKLITSNQNDAKSYRKYRNGAKDINLGQNFSKLNRFLMSQFGFPFVFLDKAGAYNIRNNDLKASESHMEDRLEALYKDIQYLDQLDSLCHFKTPCFSLAFDGISFLKMPRNERKIRSLLFSLGQQNYYMKDIFNHQTIFYDLSFEYDNLDPKEDPASPIALITISDFCASNSNSNLTRSLTKLDKVFPGFFVYLVVIGPLDLISFFSTNNPDKSPNTNFYLIRLLFNNGNNLTFLDYRTPVF